MKLVCARQIIRLNNIRNLTRNIICDPLRDVHLLQKYWKSDGRFFFMNNAKD